MGGRVGLKGTDGVVDQARAAGGDARRSRTRRTGAGPSRALPRAAGSSAAPDEMGAELAVAQGLDTVGAAIGPCRGGDQRRGDTRRRCRAPPPRRRPDPLRRGRRHGARHPRGRRRPRPGARNPDGREDALGGLRDQPGERGRRRGVVPLGRHRAPRARRPRSWTSTRRPRERAASRRGSTALLCVPDDRLRMQSAKTRSASLRRGRARRRLPCRRRRRWTRAGSTCSARERRPGGSRRTSAVPKTLLGVDAVRAGHLLGCGPRRARAARAARGRACDAASSASSAARAPSSAAATSN